MNLLLSVIITWLSINFELPPINDQPSVKFINQQQMVLIRHGPFATAAAHELIAIYEDRTKTIYLSDRWQGDTPADVSVLVHEIVHHIQNVGKVPYACAAEREALAYAAQEKWLGQFGQSLRLAFGLDPMTLKIKSMCI